MGDKKEEVVVPKTEEVIKFWNEFSSAYSNSLERVTVQAARTLYQNLKLDSASHLVELSCGPGTCALEILTLKLLPAGAKFTVSDYAEEMIALTKKRIDAAALGDSELLEIKQVDAQNLPFREASIDRILANLSLHIVPDPDKMLSEAFRALIPGGYAAFSVWGRKENSFMFTLIPIACKNLGLSFPASNVRSQFHMGGSLGELRQQVLKAGFSRVICWHQQLLFESFDSEFIVEFLTGKHMSNKKVLEENFSPEQQQAIIAEALRIVESRCEQGHPFGFEAAMVLAKK
eukprot:TRINITY_DN9666_c0_g1_i1.p2 TRINITY_DN9666_c0_g1~~TRINITY_DN9666_c0_g1_i1.p2  ORF type:complete len:289 (+),score=85.97 TRINITY_DN9666_c0_g1_i1:70-936(+)